MYISPEPKGPTPLSAWPAAARLLVSDALSSLGPGDRSRVNSSDVPSTQSPPRNTSSPATARRDPSRLALPILMQLPDT
jgi:hypothetical protein